MKIMKMIKLNLQKKLKINFLDFISKLSCLMVHHLVKLHYNINRKGQQQLYANQIRIF